jgi:phage-related minor tail protein
MKTTEFLKESAQRATTPVKPFWAKVRMIGLIIGGIGTLIVSLPLSLPAGIISAGTYLITAGGTIAGISQLTQK